MYMNNKEEINEILIDLSSSIRKARMELIEVEAEITYEDFENKNLIDKVYNILNNYKDQLSSLIETPNTNNHWNLLKALEKENNKRNRGKQVENRYFSVNGLSIWELGEGAYAIKGLTKDPDEIKIIYFKNDNQKAFIERLLDE